MSIKFGDKRYICGLFLDIVNFTTFSEKMDPEDVDDIINLYFNLFSNIIERNDGWIEKYIGDAIFAVFGKDIASIYDSYKACLSSLQILKACKNLNKKNNHSINIRIGIHTGLVAKSRRGQFEVLVGDTVNIASRIQHLANNNEILISSKVKENIVEFFDTEYKGVYSLKGKTNKIHIYKLVGIKKTVNKLVPESVIFKREQIKEFLKFYLKKTPLIVINGSKKSGKTFFLFSIYYILKNLNKNKNLILSFDPFRKIDLIQFYEKLTFEISSYIEENKINKSSINSILNNEPVLRKRNINYEDIKSKVIEIFENLKNFNILVDNLNIISDNFFSLLQNKDFNIFLKKKNILLIIASENVSLNNTIFLNKISKQEALKYINFVLKENIALSIENKIINLSNGNIGILTELCNIYKNNKKIDFSSNIEKLYFETIDKLDNYSKLILYVISLSFFPISKSLLFEIVEHFEQNDYKIFENSINILHKFNLIKINNFNIEISSTTVKKVINNSILKKNKKLIYEVLFKYEENPLVKYLYAKNSQINYKINFSTFGNNISTIDLIKILNLLLKENYNKNEIKDLIYDISFSFCTLTNLTEYKIELEMDKVLEFSQNNKLISLINFLNKNNLNSKNNELLKMPDLSFFYKFINKYDEFTELSIAYTESKNIEDITFFKNYHDQFDFTYEFIYILASFQQTKYLLFNPLKTEFSVNNIKLKISRFFFFCSKLLFLLNFNFVKKYDEILVILNNLEKLAFDIDFKLFYEIYYFYLFFIMFLSQRYDFFEYFDKINNSIVFFKEDYTFLSIFKDFSKKELNFLEHNYKESDYFKSFDLLKKIDISNIKLLPVQFPIYFILLNKEVFCNKKALSNIISSFFIIFEKETIKTNIIYNTFLEELISTLKKTFKILL